jgi:putative transposase
VTYKRQKLFCDARTIGFLRTAFYLVMGRRPFSIDAVVILPDHLHCIWELPADDYDFSTRWMLVKKHVSILFNTTKNHRGEKFVWQRRFWEHWIRDENDWQRHMDYIYYNPVKHGYVKSPGEWQYGSFHKAVEKGVYDKRWGSCEPSTINGLDYE